MKERPISERLIISMYDNTGNWAQPYIDAGYPVMLWDKQHEGDILTERAWDELISNYAPFLYGILAAPPCDDFAGSGARWWEEKDKDTERIDTSCALVEMVLIMAQYARDTLKFWVLENPVGRIEKMVPELKPFRKLMFNPCDYGDPYTKKTILWGEFNAALPKTSVLPLYGSLMHSVPPGKQRKSIRSATPHGFAKAFFQVNQ